MELGEEHILDGEEMEFQVGFRLYLEALTAEVDSGEQHDHMARLRQWGEGLSPDSMMLVMMTGMMHLTEARVRVISRDLGLEALGAGAGVCIHAVLGDECDHG